MAHRADDIRHDIADTRAAMTEKLVILEARVRETVAGTQASVEQIVEDVGGIVENVKATVDTTLVAVQRTFDLPLQVEHHPWPMFGGALLVGYMLGSRGGGRTAAAGSTRDTPGFAAGPTTERAADASSPGSPPGSRALSARPQPQQGIASGVLDQLKDEMKDEIASLKSVAVEAVMSTLREMCKQAISTLTPHTESSRTRPDGQLSDSPAQHLASVPRAAVNGVPS